jgi:uncharacterized protein (TIGR00369 family)
MERNSPYGDLVGTRILRIDRDHGAIDVEYLAHQEFTNRIGTVAGAMIAGLLDSVTGLAANAGLTGEFVAVHKSLMVEYHRPATPGRLTGRGRVVDQSGKDIQSSGELFDDAGKLLATAAATLRVISWPTEAPPGCCARPRSDGRPGR